MINQKNTLNKQKAIITEIKNLLDGLEKMLGGTAPTKTPQKYPTVKDKKGAMGVIHSLIEDGFFDSPQTITAIMNELKTIGHSSYKQEAIAMNLLNLTKQRTLKRTKDQGTKKWKYFVDNK